METVAQPPAEAELHLLTDWGDPGEGTRTRRAAVFSLLAHAALILLLVLLPGEFFAPPPVEMAPVRRVTPLVEPITELTQKAPNKGKISKEFNAAESAPRPRVQAPAMPTPPPQRAAVHPAPPPSAPAVKAPAAVPMPEPPKIESAMKEPARTELPQAPPAPPPQIQAPPIQAEAKPKSLFENVTPPPGPVPAGRSQIPIPNPSVGEAIRQASRGNQAGGLVIGDAGAASPGGYGGGINSLPSPGVPGSSLQLLSDPMGVDFKPYLTQILATVRRNWQAVMPESVKLGRRGKVAIQFSIARTGQVPKLVIASYSGTDALDRAAVAGISASVPFPPLPAEFKGDRVVLQFNFAYNLPRQ